MFQGSFVALVTPFDAQGRVNFDKLAQLCKWHVAQGTAGIVAPVSYTHLDVYKRQGHGRPFPRIGWGGEVSL